LLRCCKPRLRPPLVPRKAATGKTSMCFFQVGEWANKAALAVLNLAVLNSIPPHPILYNPAQAKPPAGRGGRLRAAPSPLPPRFLAPDRPSAASRLALSASPLPAPFALGCCLGAHLHAVPSAAKGCGAEFVRIAGGGADFRWPAAAARNLGVMIGRGGLHSRSNSKTDTIQPQ